MFTSPLRVAMVGILFLAIVSAVRADEAKDDFRLDVVPARPFAKGTKTFEVEGSYTVPIRFSVEEVTTGSVGVGYYVFDNHSLTLFAQGFHVNQAFGESADAGAVFLLGRWHFYNPERFTVYFDGGGGYSWANEAVPIGGTTYNFTARAGFGVGYRLADDTYLMGGARYFHLSNAQQHGRSKNPSMDGVECYVGLMFAFR